MNQSIERTALSNLITNEDYARKVIPFLKGDYFKIREERIVFEEIQRFVDKYKKIPTKTALEIEVENRKDLNQDDHDKIVKLITSLDSTNVDLEWLLDTTEKFCKDKAIYNAIVEGVEIIDGKDKKRTPDAIPDILTDALAVSFDNSVGHDYLADGQQRILKILCLYFYPLHQHEAQTGRVHQAYIFLIVYLLVHTFVETL